jgi:hypothetical protein
MTDPDTRFYNPDLGDTVFTPGGCDYKPVPVDVVDYAEINTWENYNVTESIKEAVQNPRLFFGFMIKQFVDRRENERACPENNSNQGRAYYSSEHADIDMRPKLTVTYISTGIHNNLHNEGLKLVLGPAFPNPVRNYTTIAYCIPEAGSVQFEIYNANGKMVYSYTVNHDKTGTHSVKWDGTSNTGACISNGIYIYRLITKHGELSRSLFAIK